jgi:hypothetical protein
MNIYYWINISERSRHLQRSTVFDRCAGSPWGRGSPDLMRKSHVRQCIDTETTPTFICFLYRHTKFMSYLR